MELVCRIQVPAAIWIGHDLQISLLNLREVDTGHRVIDAVAVSYVLDMDGNRVSNAISLLYDPVTGNYRGQMRASQTSTLTAGTWYWIEIAAGRDLSRLYYRIRRRALYRGHRSPREGYDYRL